MSDARTPGASPGGGGASAAWLSPGPLGVAQFLVCWLILQAGCFGYYVVSPLEDFLFLGRCSARLYKDGRGVGGGFRISPALKASLVLVTRVRLAPGADRLGGSAPKAPLPGPRVQLAKAEREPARVRPPAEPGCPPSPAGRALAPLDKGAGFLSLHPVGLGCPGGAGGKEPACRCRRCEKIPWRRAWQPTPVFLPGEAHGQRSLAGSRGSHRVGHAEAT